jgi:hypothetical protein
MEEPNAHADVEGGEMHGSSQGPHGVELCAVKVRADVADTQERTNTVRNTAVYG